MEALCCIFSHRLCLMASKHSYSVLRSGHTFAGINPDWANAKNHVTRLQFLLRSFFSLGQKTSTPRNYLLHSKTTSSYYVFNFNYNYSPVQSTVCKEIFPI